MTLYYDTFTTPLTGQFTIAVNDNSAVVASAFGDEKILRKRINKAAA